MKNTALPKTTGKWAPIVRGKGTNAEKIVGYLEVFYAGKHLPYCSVPGASRCIEVK